MAAGSSDSKPTASSVTIGRRSPFLPPRAGSALDRAVASGKTTGVESISATEAVRERGTSALSSEPVLLLASVKRDTSRLGGPPLTRERGGPRGGDRALDGEGGVSELGGVGAGKAPSPTASST